MSSEVRPCADWAYGWRGGRFRSGGVGGRSGETSMPEVVFIARAARTRFANARFSDRILGRFHDWATDDRW